MYFSATGKLQSMPASWTDVTSGDAFHKAAAGRSWFRVDDLLALTALVQDLRPKKRRRVK